jgi:hypothetical protein
MRKLMIVLAAIATIGAGATLPAFARGGGGHGGHGGHGGMGHGGHGGFGRAAGTGHGGMARAGFARPGGIGRVAGVRTAGWHGHRFAGNKFAFRHHRFHRRFAFIGAGFGYSAYDSCITPVWTAWGWRWTNVCYY